MIMKTLSDCANGKKDEHKVIKENKSVMQTTNEQVTIVSELAKCVTRMKTIVCIGSIK